MLNVSTLICGAGINGLTIARELVKTGHDDILIIDKEPGPGVHASGRNSGVLHAGIYYAPGSLRAKSCLEGNFRMKDYCREKGLPLLETGKVIVARTPEELPTLMELADRATRNGAKVDVIDEQALAEMEPNAKTVEKALHSHYTAVVDPRAIMKSLRADLEATGKVAFDFNAPFLGREKGDVAVTGAGRIRYKRFINTAGAHADTVARAYGLAEGYVLIPFKGIYKKLKKGAADLIRGSIYPVPNIKNPFLGVHFTRGASGDVYLGPTAIPALGRENYRYFDGLSLETLSILYHDALLFAANEKFRGVALEEPRKYIFKYFFEDARKLVKELDPSDIEPSPKSGIRPQLVDLKRNELVMDFVIQKTENTVHVLNAISPAFTSSMSFAEMVVRDHVA